MSDCSAKCFHHGWKALGSGFLCTLVAGIFPFIVWFTGTIPFAQTTNMPWNWSFFIGLGVSLFGQTTIMCYFTLKKYETTFDVSRIVFLILSMVLVASALFSALFSKTPELHVCLVITYCCVLVALDIVAYCKVKNDERARVYRNNIIDIFTSVDLPVTIVISIWLILYYSCHELKLLGGPMQIKLNGNTFYFEDGVMAGVIGFQMIFVFIAIIFLLLKWELSAYEPHRSQISGPAGIASNNESEASINSKST